MYCFFWIGLLVIQDLFIPQGIDRISQGGFNRLVADSQKGDNKGCQAGKDEDTYSQIRPVGKALQPFMHGVIGDGPGDYV